MAASAGSRFERPGSRALGWQRARAGKQLLTPTGLWAAVNASPSISPDPGQPPSHVCGPAHAAKDADREVTQD